MVSLRQDSRGNFFARKRLPDDVREEYGRLYGARFEAKFFVRASVGKQVAQQKFREWANEVEQRIEAIREALRGEGIDLDREQATALAGEWYLWFVSNYEKEDADMRWARDREVREGVRPVVADLGHTAQFLASRGLALTNKAQGLFLERVLDNYEQALLRLERCARGDYSPDKLPKTFPQFTKREEAKSTGPTPWELFAAWVDAKRPAQSTIESWRTVFNALTRDFPERSAASISIDEAQQWIDRLITVDRSAFTVRNTWSRATRAIYRWAIGDAS